MTTLARVDYQDRFAVEIGPTGHRTAEEWMRAMIDGAPLKLRWMLVSTWLALGLKLGPPWSPDRVLGWEVRSSTPDRVLVGAGSRYGMPAELLLERQESSLVMATFMQHDNAFARALWSVVAPRHQRVVPYVLGQVRRAK
jgi:hypothetical protein